MFKFLIKIIDILCPKYDNQKVIDNLDKYEIYKKIQPKNKDGVYVLCDYAEFVIQTLVKQAKYYKNKKAIDIIADGLFGVIQEISLSIQEISEKNIVICGIPINKNRKETEEYDHIKLILKHVEKKSLNTDMYKINYKLLYWNKNIKRQSKLKKGERIQNVSGALSVFCPKTISKNTKYIIIDDIKTTGATLNEAKRVLKMAGASDITLVAFATNMQF